MPANGTTGVCDWPQHRAIRACNAGKDRYAHGTAHQVHVARWSIAHILRRTGRPEEARALLLDLKENSEPDTYVDDELALLNG